MMTMCLFHVKTAAVSSVYKSRDITAACDAILESGFDYIEVMAYPPHVDLSGSLVARDLLSPYEGKISGFGIYENLADLRETHRVQAVEKTLTLIELCSRTKGMYIVCQTGITPSFLKSEARAAFEKSLDQILPAAHEHQVTLAFENARSTLLSTVEETISFLAQHTDPAVCLTIDPVNFYEAQCSLYDIEPLIPRTVNVHVKNVIHGEEAPASHGEVDFRKVLSMPWNCIFTAEYEETARTEEFLQDALSLLR
jgi:sugar phosphate isomerase/epimerase